MLSNCYLFVKLRKHWKFCDRYQRKNLYLNRQFLIGLFIVSLFPPLFAHGQEKGSDSRGLLKFHSSFEEKVLEDYSSGKVNAITDFYLIADEEINENTRKAFRADLENYIALLKRKQEKYDEEKFLQFLFYKTHRKYLKFYEQYSSFSKTLDKGYYDCLSATALYTLLLDELNFQYEIRETDYHIYLLVKNKDNKNYLFEATDPVNGFVKEEKEIKKRQEFYTEATSFDAEKTGVSSNKKTFQFSKSVNNKVNKLQLAGLLYYNKAIALYNQHAMVMAFENLKKGMLLYDSPRLKEFLSLIVQVANEEDSLSEEQKKQLREDYFTWIRKGPYKAPSVTFNTSPY